MLSPIGRVSFHSAYHATAMEDDQTKKFSNTLIFDHANMKGDQHQKLAEMKRLAEDLSMEKFGVKLGETYKGKIVKTPFRRTDEKPDYMEPGQIFVKFSSVKQKPNVVDMDKGPISEDSGDFYNGCYAHCSYTLYAYDRGGNRGIAFGLGNIQKTADGEPFGAARTSVDDDFEVIDQPETVGALDADDDIAF